MTNDSALLAKGTLE